MKAQLATPAAGSPARSPSRVQRQASAGPAPDTPRGLPARAGRSEYAAIHAAAAHGIATPWSAPPHAGVPGVRPRTQVLASHAVAQPKLSIDGPRGAVAAAAIAPTGGGSPLPDPTRARMEGLFGVHLDGVRVVTSGQPEQLGARAFAIGDEIHAARGEDLAASRNAELLGHELAHVVQQRQGRARPDSAQDHGGALVVDAALEAEADAVGARIGRDEPAGIGGADAACPAPIAQGYQIKLESEPEPFTEVDQLINAFRQQKLEPDGGWNKDRRGLLFQWMREDRTFTSRTALIDEVKNTPVPRPAAAPANVNELVKRYQDVFAICRTYEEITRFVGNREAITQVPQERGDMFDVASALELDSQLCVVVIPDGPIGDCDKILDFYRDFKAQVCLVTGVQLNRAGFKKVSYSTTTMYDLRDSPDFPSKLAQAMTGEFTDNEGKAFEDEFQRHHLERGGHYALVMYRDSGHNPGHERSPSHPELDTGTEGFDNLFELIREELKGVRTPVPMGTQRPTKKFSVRRDPNLIDYWQWDCFAAYPEGTNRRQKENALLRHLRDYCDVVAIGMRSGAMDTLAYVGIPIISIDAASEFMSQSVRKKHNIHANSAKSWRRAAKKEAMLPGMYHNVYLGELREDPHVDELYGKQPRSKVPFEGAFGEDNQERLKDAVTHYGHGTPSGARNLHWSSPLTSANTKSVIAKLDTKLENTKAITDAAEAIEAVKDAQADINFYAKFADNREPFEKLKQMADDLLQAIKARNTGNGRWAAPANYW